MRDTNLLGGAEPRPMMHLPRLELPRVLGPFTSFGIYRGMSSRFAVLGRLVTVDSHFNSSNINVYSLASYLLS